MRETSVTEVDQSAVSDDEDDDKSDSKKFTLSVLSQKPEKQTTTFLNFTSQEEKVIPLPWHIGIFLCAIPPPPICI